MLEQSIIGIVEQLFQSNEVQMAIQLIESECCTKIPLWNGPYDMLHTAVLKLSQGDLEQLRKWIKEAQIDWRDILIAADFADANASYKNWNS